MEKIKVVELPKEVLDKVKILGNVFDKAEKKKEVFESIVCQLMNVLYQKYNFDPNNWNEDIAPILRKYLD